MRVYRCHANSPLDAGQTVELDEEEAHHLVKVRRAAAGSPVVVMNGEGATGEGELVISGKHARIMLARVHRTPRPQGLELACALTKSADFEEMIQRAVELGMTRFLPLITERTVVDFDAKRAAKKVEKWRRIAIEALKQCERPWLPTISEPMELGEALDLTGDGDGVVPVLLLERALTSQPLQQVAGELGGRTLRLFIGPEGGWSTREVELFGNEGCRVASLTTAAILRTETAALAALAVLGR